MNVNEKTLRLTSGGVVKKGFCRRKLLDAISVRQQEAVETLQHAWIVFNDSDGAHPIANRNEEKFAGQQPIVGDLQGEEPAVSCISGGLCISPLSQAVAGVSVAQHTTLLQRARRRYAKSNLTLKYAGSARVISVVIAKAPTARELAC